MLGGPGSVAVIEKVDGELAPFSVTAKTCTPLSPAANVWFPGNVALGLSVAIATVPTYPVAPLPNCVLRGRGPGSCLSARTRCWEARDLQCRRRVGFHGDSRLAAGNARSDGVRRRDRGAAGGGLQRHAERVHAAVGHGVRVIG